MLNTLWQRQNSGSPHGLTGYKIEAGARDGRPDTKATSLSPVVGVLAAKGGAGATTVAANLAGAISPRLSPTVLVDANLQQPEIADMFGQEPRYTLLDLVLRAKGLTEDVLTACCVDITGGANRLLLLSPPPGGEAHLRTSLTELAECLVTMRPFAGCWVVDLPRHLDRHLVSLLDRCTAVILVLEPTLAGIAGARRWLDVFAELDYGADKIVCVLNRVGSTERVFEEQIDKCLEGRTVFKLPNAFKLLQRCAHRGETATLAFPNTAYTRAIFNLAGFLMKG